MDAQARRLLWHCRRGMKELDVLLERFARSYLADADAEARALFERFLELPDPVLADYLLGDAVPADVPLARLARSITAHTSPTASC
jgi:antitoxin CptB